MQINRRMGQRKNGRQQTLWLSRSTHSLHAKHLWTRNKTRSGTRNVGEKQLKYAFWKIFWMFRSVFGRSCIPVMMHSEYLRQKMRTDTSNRLNIYSQLKSFEFWGSYPEEFQQTSRMRYLMYQKRMQIYVLIRFVKTCLKNWSRCNYESQLLHT